VLTRSNRSFNTKGFSFSHIMHLCISHHFQNLAIILHENINRLNVVMKLSV